MTSSATAHSKKGGGTYVEPWGRQRGVRRAGPRLPARAWHRQRKIERQRRRDCDRTPAWLQRRPPGHDADPPDGSHRRLARHRVALRRGRTRLGDGLRTRVSLEMGRIVRSFVAPHAESRRLWLACHRASKRSIQIGTICGNRSITSRPTRTSSTYPMCSMSTIRHK